MSKNKELDLSGFYEELENEKKALQDSSKKELDLSGFYEELEAENLKTQQQDLDAEAEYSPPSPSQKRMPLDDYRERLSKIKDWSKDAASYLAGGAKAFAHGALEGALLGFSDEALAKLITNFDNKEDYEKTLRDIEAARKKRKEEFPITSLAGEVVGGAVVPLGIASKTAAFAKNIPLTARLPALLKQGVMLAPTGAAAGAAQELGTSEKSLKEMTNQELSETLAAGAIRGGVLSLVAPAMGDMAISGAKTLAKAGKVLASKAYLDDALDALKLVFKKKVDLNDPVSRKLLSQEAVDLIKTPAELAEAQIKSQKIAPLQFDVNRQVKALQEMSEQEIAKQSRQIEAEALIKAQDFLENLKNISKAAGSKIEKIKMDLLTKNPDAQLEALPKTISKVEKIIQETPNLRSDPEALRILEDFKAEISDTIRPAVTKTETLISTSGKKTPTTKTTFTSKSKDLTPEELAEIYDKAPETIQKQIELGYKGTTPFENLQDKLAPPANPADVLPKGGKFLTKTVSESPAETVQKEKIGLEKTFKLLRDLQEQGSSLRQDPKLKQLGGLFTKAGGEAKSLIYKELGKITEPKTVKELAAANKIYSNFLNFSKKYNIDLTDPEAAAAELVKYAEKLPVEAKAKLSSNAQVKEFLTDLSKISPKLSESFKESFEKVKAQAANQPLVVSRPEILKTFEKAVELDSTSPLKTLKEAGINLDSEDVSKLLDRVKQLKEAEDLLKTVDYKRLLTTSKGALDTSNLRSFEMFDEFKQALGKTLSPEYLQNYGKKLDEALADLRIARIFDDDINVGGYRRSIIAGGGFVGDLSRKVYDFAKASQKTVLDPPKRLIKKGVLKASEAAGRYSPEFLKQIANAAKKLGKDTLAHTLQSMKDKDNVARSASFYMLRQDPKLRKDFEEVLREFESEDGSYEE